MYPDELIEQLFPTIWDRTWSWGLQNEAAPDPDMPKAKYVDPKQATVFWTHLIDIRTAWLEAVLSLKERRALLLYHGLGYTQQEIADLERVSKKQINKRLSRGLAAVAAYLNDAPMTYVDKE